MGTAETPLSPENTQAVQFQNRHLASRGEFPSLAKEGWPRHQ